MSTVRALGILLSCLIAAHALAFVQPEEQSKAALRFEPAGASPRGATLEVASDPTAAGAAARAFVERHGAGWQFRVDHRTGRADLVQGRGIPLLPGRGNRLDDAALAGFAQPDGQIRIETVEPRVRGLLDAHPELFGIARGTLRIDPNASQVRDRGRLISVYYEWFVDGIPVEGARVFARINNGNVTQLGAPLVGPMDLDTRPVVDLDTARRSLLAHTGDAETARMEDSGELRIQPEDGPGRLDYRLVWRFVYTIRDQLETWEGRVDAHTGEIVAFRDLSRYMRGVGGVYPRTIIENNETVVHMPFLEAEIESGFITADTSGKLPYAGGDFFTGLSGRWFRMNCDGCSSPDQAGVNGSLGSGFVDFGVGGGPDALGNGISTPADRNAFFHLNQIRRIAVKWLPSVPLFSRTHFSVNVNINANCNAQYSDTFMRFFTSGGGCNNTAEVADVMYHEYGHGVDIHTLGGDSATGEASADVVTIHQTHSPLIGPGFRTNGSPVRNLDRFTDPKGTLTVSNLLTECPGGSGPLGGEVHCEGEIYGQTAWDLALALVAKHGEHTGWRTSEKVFYTSLPDAESYLSNGSNPIYDAYINADDDDGNLANGTPNGAEIFEAFERHEIAGAAQVNSAACTRPAQPVLSVTPECDRFDLSWSAVGAADHYEIFRAELLEDMAFFPVAQVPSGQTTFSDTEVGPAFDYWYVVMAVDASGCESTIESPVAARLTAQPILTVTAAASDDMPRGNRSGFPDPGEEVDVSVVLANFGEIDALSVVGTVVPVTPGVTMLEDATNFPSLAVGAAGPSQDVLRFETDDQQVSCGDAVRFQVLPDEASTCAAATSFFDVRMGRRIEVAGDDFESDQGWAPDLVNSTAATGTWVRGVPDGTNFQPDRDVSPGGSMAWFTGTNPGGDGDADVDDGVAILVSPTFDLSGETTVEYSYYRWFANSSASSDVGDFFTADVSDDDGASWVNLETLDSTQTDSRWVRRAHRLEQFIQLNDQVRFRFQAADGTEGSIVEAAIDELRLDRFECDLTPACFVEPTFSGVTSATAGTSCGEIELSWSPAASNCINAEISYNIYRSTTSGFSPGAATLVATDLTATNFTDFLLDPGLDYFYVVRAHDSRSGEETNLVELSAVSPSEPDVRAPAFAGLDLGASGATCGAIVLNWDEALESCSGPAAYDVYRSTDPGFVPGPASLAASTFSDGYTDLALTPGTNYTYVVRARDTLGNAEVNDVRMTVQAKALDRTLAFTEFEPNDGGWSVVAPDDATEGNWEWGNPVGTSFQPEDDFTPSGVNCWITGRSAGASNNDVDGGTTTLLSAAYNMDGAVAPVARYARWFTNDQGGSAGDPTDDFVVEVSNDDGQNWTELDRLGGGTPLAWVEEAIPIPISPTSQMRFRFTAADLGDGSLVEAAVDDFEIVDPGQGCAAGLCGFNPANSCTVNVRRLGNDIEVSWPTDLIGRDAVVYAVRGCNDQIRIGSTGGSSLIHENAALSPESFSYRVTFVDDCGRETPIDACVTLSCP